MGNLNLNAYPCGARLRAYLECLLCTERSTTPSIHGGLSVTSDGFVIGSVRVSETQGHDGAFLGDWTDLERNLCGWADHFNLPKAEREEIAAAIRKRVTDWTPSKRVERTATRITGH